MVVWLLDGHGRILTAATIAAAVGFVAAYDPVLGFIALAAAVLALLVLAAPQAVLLVLLAALPWEGVLGYPSDALSVVKLLGMLLLVAFLFKTLQGDHRLRAPPTTYAVGLLGLLVTLSFIVSPAPGAESGTLLRYYLFLGFFFLMVQLVQDEAGVLKVLRVTALSVTVASMVGLISFLQGHVDRVAGPIPDPNDFGYLMATTLPLLGYLIIADRRWRPVWAVSFPIVLAGTLATLSRGAIVAVGALLVWALLTRRIKLGGLILSTAALAAVLIAGLLLFSPLINERLESKSNIAAENVDSREALWRGAIAMSMDHPVTGVGPGRFGVESTDYVRDNPIVLSDPVAHNTYLQILAESGPFTLAAFLAFLGGSWISLSRYRKRCAAVPDVAGVRLATAVQAGLLVAIVGGVFLSENLANPLWLLGALAAIITGPVASRQLPVPQTTASRRPAGRPEFAQSH